MIALLKTKQFEKQIAFIDFKDNLRRFSVDSCDVWCLKIKILFVLRLIPKVNVPNHTGLKGLDILLSPENLMFTNCDIQNVKKYVVGSVSVLFHNFHSNIFFSEHIRPCHFQITHFDWFTFLKKKKKKNQLSINTFFFNLK